MKGDIPMRRILFTSLILGIALAASALPLHTPSALAADNAPCGAPYKHGTIIVQKCPLWRGAVGVYDLSTGRKVGQLDVGGSANWFVCQAKFINHPASYGGYSNVWWAYTRADNGQWGWVSEVFFSGGGDFERDARLAIC
jgi:hypothetical protein